MQKEVGVADTEDEPELMDSEKSSFEDGVASREPWWKSSPDPLAGFPEDCSQYPGSGELPNGRMRRRSS